MIGVSAGVVFAGCLKVVTQGGAGAYPGAAPVKAFRRFESFLIFPKEWDTWKPCWLARCSSDRV